MNKPHVFVLTACHNEKDRILSLLKDLHKQAYNMLTIVVVDDDSTDGTTKTIHQKYPMVEIIKGDGNLWWTGSIAKGISWILTKAKKHDYVITINADCRVNPHFVKTLVSISNAHPQTIFGSTIRDLKTNILADAAVMLDWRTGKFSQNLEILTNPILKSGVLSTKGTIFPISVFHRIGNFNYQKLPHYLSDYEFSLRASKHGYLLRTATNSVVKNDTVRTGLGDQGIKNLSFKQRWKLLFDRRSRLNILDHYNFIIMHAPAKYLVRNILIIVVKSLYILFRPAV